MTHIFLLTLVLFFIGYGSLLIVGGPPMANRLATFVAGLFLAVVRWLIHAVCELVRAVAVPLVRFLLCRPRR